MGGTVNVFNEQRVDRSFQPKTLTNFILRANFTPNINQK